MTSTNDYIAAQGDPDLLARFIAAAQMAGISGASNWVSTHYSELLNFHVSQDQTVADVYAYAKAVREQAVAALPLAPGENMAAVTDAYLASAIAAVSGT